MRIPVIEGPAEVAARMDQLARIGVDIHLPVSDFVDRLHVFPPQPEVQSESRVTLKSSWETVRSARSGGPRCLLLRHGPWS